MPQHRAITICQPYAHLIVTGQKRVENRIWPTSYRGPILIHAGKSRSYGGDSVEEIAMCHNIDPAVLVFGAVVGTANLVDCVKLVPRPRKHSYDRGPGLMPPEWAKQKHPWLAEHLHTVGPYCFVLADVRRLATPVPSRGAQRIFWLDIEI